MMATVIDVLAGGLVVSCQVPPGDPLSPPGMIARLARCAQLGGAAGVRVNHPRTVRATRQAVDLPVIGLHKTYGARARITMTFAQADRLVAAGADIVALEVTHETGLERALRLVKRVRDELGAPVMADISTLAEARRAWDAGAELVATTLSGYTPDSPRSNDPDLDLVEEVAASGIHCVAEGRYRTATQIRDALARGAHAVVVGTAITDPTAITASLVAALERRP
jgi:N-acylglucosamine-6-phosphate 2-epimerase